jgi:phosphoglycerate kinase
MDKTTVRDIEVAHKRVLVRADFNVPLDNETGNIIDDSRIRAVIPTIKHLTEREAKVILCSHLGRPEGNTVEKLRLAIVAERLSHILGQPVSMAADCIGPIAEKEVEGLGNGEILVLENLRFHAEEEENEDSFAQALSRLADIYVNDAFAVSHRAHASIVGIAHYLTAVAGFLFENEIDNLNSMLENPKRPFGAIIGGAKIGDKVSMLENIMDKADYVLIGGGLAATFLKASSYDTGQSLIDLSKLETATRLIKKANANGTTIKLPQDVVVSHGLRPLSKTKTVSIGEIRKNSRIVDIGPMTVIDFYRVMRKCHTVFWNGTMGMHEIPQFAGGTKSIARLLANLNAVSVVGGGSTAEAVNGMGLADKMSFVSTGGGAALEFLSGQVLPGVQVLLNKMPVKVFAHNRVISQVATKV